MLTLAVLLGIVVSACSTSAADSATEEVTEGSVDRAWAEAAECLTDNGYSVETQRVDNSWSLLFDGTPEESDAFFDLYNGCVTDAESVNLAFLRMQVPEGAERVELASEFQICLGSAGVENPVTYDPNNPDQVSALADAQTQLGYALDDPAVTDDQRFTDVLICFDTYELLFPDRFVAAE